MNFDSAVQYAAPDVSNRPLPVPAPAEEETPATPTDDNDEPGEDPEATKENPRSRPQ